jgi:hypothetical protein
MPNKSGLLGSQRSVDYHLVSSASMDGRSMIAYADRDAEDHTLEGMIKSMYDSNFTYKNNVNTGAWFCIHAHRLDGIDPATNMTREAKLDTVFKNYLAPAIAAGHVWAATFPDVAMYAQERDKATLSVTLHTGNEIKYTLTDEMDDALFNYPLTVKVKIEPSWQNVTALQNGDALPIEELVDGSNKYVLIQTVPDKGEVTVSPDQGTINAFPDSNGSLTIHPNPFADHLTIETTGGGIAFICDLSGKTMLNTALKAGSNHVNTSSLSPGVYILKYNSEIHKIIKLK